jgi:hypothetical protein
MDTRVGRVALARLVDELSVEAWIGAVTVGFFACR